ncbi:porin family protein [Psychroflexus tropicus]|uniref:porin family protein n=1 Tax=Psychroflexus tropicus TaxID=197345 RepID=UPI000379C7CE|nr:porin family protein [Psychroflexus tropicus]
MKFTYFFLFLCFFSSAVAQDDLTWLKENQQDYLYREDQFYFGFSFNFLTDLPSEVEQSGFSGGLILGFIRDMPLNTRRNLAVGLGLGLNLNTYGQTLQISETEGGDQLFEPIPSSRNYQSNRFTTNSIEVPLEIRWRSSDIGKLSFWRIYAGVKIGYVFTSKSVYRGSDQRYDFRSINAINNVTSSAILTFGYGSVNFFVDLSLNSVFDAQINSTGEDVSVRPIKAGLVFYFL